MKVNILGTDYKIKKCKISEDKHMKKMNLSGYCAEMGKYIVIADMTDPEYFPNMDVSEQERYRKEVLRHEIIHAFLNESGLSNCSSTPEGPWAKHEEMIDWIAIQSPKLFKAFKEAGAL